MNAAGGNNNNLGTNLLWLILMLTIFSVCFISKVRAQETIYVDMLNGDMVKATVYYDPCVSCGSIVSCRHRHSYYGPYMYDVVRYIEPTGHYYRGLEVYIGYKYQTKPVHYNRVVITSPYVVHHHHHHYTPTYHSKPAPPKPKPQPNYKPKPQPKPSSSNSIVRSSTHSSTQVHSTKPQSTRSSVSTRSSGNNNVNTNKSTNNTVRTSK